MAAVVVVVADVETRVQICTFVRGRTVPFEKRSKKGPSCWVVVVGGGLLASAVFYCSLVKLPGLVDC